MKSYLFLLQTYFRISILAFFNPKKCSLRPKLTFSHFYVNQPLSKVGYFKGQLISKCLFGVFTFFQKTNENKQTSSKVEFVHSFFGRNVSLKKSFRICLTFSKIEEVFLCCPDCPNGPKQQIRFTNLAVHISISALFISDVYTLLGKFSHILLHCLLIAIKQTHFTLFQVQTNRAENKFRPCAIYKRPI